MPDPAIKISGLSKHFGPKTALDGVDISLQPGEFLTVFGPNGSGKTTMMRIIASLSRPSTGSVELFGKDIRRAPAHARQRIGFVTHRSLLYSSLSGFQNVHFFARMFGVDNAADRTHEILSVMGLEHRMDDEVFTYSRGLEQRDEQLLPSFFAGREVDRVHESEQLHAAPAGQRALHHARRGRDAAKDDVQHIEHELVALLVPEREMAGVRIEGARSVYPALSDPYR